MTSTLSPSPSFALGVLRQFKAAALSPSRSAFPLALGKTGQKRLVYPRNHVEQWWGHKKPDLEQVVYRNPPRSTSCTSPSRLSLFSLFHITISTSHTSRNLLEQFQYAI